MAPSVAICICTRDRPLELATALQSIAYSSVSVRRVVVSDDGGSYGADEVCRDAACAHVITHTRGPRSGLAANRNHALTLVDEELVLFLDDDCLLSRDFMAIATACLTRHEQRFGAGKVIVSGSEQNRGSSIVPHAQTFLGFQGRPYRECEPLSTIVINATLFPRKLFDEVKFDPQIRYGYDEVDLATRAVRTGYRIACCPDAANDHRPSHRGRNDYAHVVVASRLYVTFKRYAFTDRMPIRAFCFALIAPVHTCVAGVRRQRIAGGRQALAAIVLAGRYVKRHKCAGSTPAASPR